MWFVCCTLHMCKSFGFAEVNEHVHCTKGRQYSGHVQYIRHTYIMKGGLLSDEWTYTQATTHIMQ